MVDETSVFQLRCLAPVSFSAFINPAIFAFSLNDGYATGLNMNRLETMNARQHIREGVFGLRCIVIGLQADPETVAGTEEARQA